MDDIVSLRLSLLEIVKDLHPRMTIDKTVAESLVVAAQTLEEYVLAKR